MLEPPSPEPTEEPPTDGPSMLTTMLKRSPPDPRFSKQLKEDQVQEDGISVDDGEDDVQSLTGVSTVEPRPLLTHYDTGGETSETSPLLTTRSRGTPSSYGLSNGNGGGYDVEGLKVPGRRNWPGRVAASMRDKTGRIASVFSTASNLRHWNRHALWKSVVVAPVACLPAVVVGLLLNILDALSYGEHHEVLPAHRCTN